MSKIRIVGHASGSGILTIAAPNTDTDRTITIPDVTGTLLDSGSDLPAANLTGTVADARISALTASKLTGALPAISAANLTAIPAANITGTLPAISATNLTNVPAANITGTLPAISGANLTSVRDTTGGRKNMIINGAMQFDQRLSGSSVSMTTGTRNVDRYYGYANVTSKLTMEQNAAAVTPPIGFTNYQGITSASSYTAASGNIFVFVQKIEGVNTSQLAWGTSGAKAASLSFKVRSSKTGTFSGHIANSAQDRSYCYTYTISNANTWEDITVSIPAITTGTWLTAKNTGVRVGFDLGTGSNYLTSSANSWLSSTHYGTAGSQSIVATSGATWYVTGVQLELGSVATDFEHRSYGEELSLCMRYYYSTMFLNEANSMTAPTNNSQQIQGTRHRFADVTGYRSQNIQHQVPMRGSPSFVVYNPSNSGATSQWQLYSETGASQNFTGFITANTTTSFILAGYTGVSVGTTGLSTVSYIHWSADAEL